MKRSKATIVIVAAAVIAIAVPLILLYESGKFAALLAGQPRTDDAADKEQTFATPVVYRKPLLEGEAALPDGKGDPGLRISEETSKGLTLETAAVVQATKKRPLPPQLGTLNFDNEYMFQIKPRFPGSELVAVATVKETKQYFVDGSPRYKTEERFLKFGDKVKQGDVLAEYWSVTLGSQKAAFVDAISAVRLSEETLHRQRKLFEQGALSESALKATERQVRADNLALLTAERTLRMWRLGDGEIKELRKEADEILDAGKPRDIVTEVKRWASVKVTVPWFDRSEEGKKRELTILEKNTNIGDIVDQTNFNTTLFKLADMSRLQIWVHPPEEYLPIIDRGLARTGSLNGSGKIKWHIRFQANPPETPPLVLEIDRVAPSFEPTQHNPMVLGYLDNKDYRYRVGQAVTATIFVEPEPDTVQIPTDALNEIKGQSFVFVRDDKDKNDYSCRRVSVVARFKDFSSVRSKLTDEQEKISAQEVKQGRWPLRPLLPGELVVTRGVVEMTTALETLLTREKANKR